MYDGGDDSEAKDHWGWGILWGQVMIYFLKGQFVTVELEIVILHFNSSPTARELAI